MRYALFFIVLCGLALAWLISDVPGHAMLASGLAILALLAPRTWSTTVGLGMAIALWLGGRWLTDQIGMTGEQLPRLFDTGLAIHFFLWIATRGEFDQAKALWLSIVGSGFILVSLEALEIYYANDLLIWSLGFLGLAAAIGSGLEKRATILGVSAVIAFAIASALLVPPSKRVAFELRHRFGESVEAASLEDFAPPTEATRAGPSTGNGRELPRRAKIELSDRVRILAQVDSQEGYLSTIARPLYLRTQVASVFRDAEQLLPLRRSEWRYDADDGTVDGRVELASAPDSVIGLTLFAEASDAKALPLPASTTRLDVESVYELAEEWYQLALEEDEKRIRYHVAAESPSEPAPASTSRFATRAEPVYTQTPNTTSLNLPRVTGTATEQLDAIQSWIQSRASYSLEYENPNDLPALENFLNGERRGHCELFAAATVAALRANGIPSRLAWGYCGGVAVPDQRLVAFRESDFHAWAEVAMEEDGWTIFDTTPVGEGARQVAASAGIDRRSSALNLASYTDLSASFDASAAQRGPSALDYLKRAALFIADHFFWLLAAALLTGLIWFAGRRLGTSKRRESSGWQLDSTIPGRRSREQRTPDFLTEFFRYWMRRGNKRRPSQTLAEFVDELKTSDLCGPELDEMTAYVYGIRYEKAVRDLEKERSFLARVRELQN